MHHKPLTLGAWIAILLMALTCGCTPETQDPTATPSPPPTEPGTLVPTAPAENDLENNPVVQTAREYSRQIAWAWLTRNCGAISDLRFGGEISANSICDQDELSEDPALKIAPDPIKIGPDAYTPVSAETQPDGAIRLGVCYRSTDSMYYDFRFGSRRTSTSANQFMIYRTYEPVGENSDSGATPEYTWIGSEMTSESCDDVVVVDQIFEDWESLIETYWK